MYDASKPVRLQANQLAFSLRPAYSRSIHWIASSPASTLPMSTEAS